MGHFRKKLPSTAEWLSVFGQAWLDQTLVLGQKLGTRSDLISTADVTLTKFVRLDCTVVHLY